MIKSPERRNRSRAKKRRFTPYPPPKPQTAQPPTHDMANKGPIGGPGTRPGSVLRAAFRVIGGGSVRLQNKKSIR